MTQASGIKDEQALHDMIIGFDSLLENVDALRARNNELQLQLDALRKKTLVTPAATEDGESCSRTPGRILQRSRETNALPLESRAIRKAREISKAWHEEQASHNPPKTAQAAPVVDLPEGHPDIEQDFTTPGATPGELGCPFAAMMAGKNNARSPSVAVKADPIAAEFHSNSLSSPPQSASGTAAKCPIRFMSDHKPEEVAQYFERHKHEIPRSHEVCIKRYQTNEASIRQLDAKYGNLESMLQGLGQKHKPLLPQEVEEEDEEGSQVLSEKDLAKIQRWAGDVKNDHITESPVFKQVEVDTAQSETRTPRFERDLRDVRLGESPSRPWGIQVPAEVEDEAAARVSGPAHVGDAVFDQSKGSDSVHAAPNECPLKDAGVGSRQAQNKATSRAPMVFNGPVFFGYSAEDMARLLQQVPGLHSSQSASR